MMLKPSCYLYTRLMIAIIGLAIAEKIMKQRSKATVTLGFLVFLTR